MCNGAVKKQTVSDYYNPEMEHQCYDTAYNCRTVQSIANSFHNKCSCYCHSELTLTSLLLSLHKCNSDTTIANNYWPHFCRTNVEEFTVLYQGPEICTSPPGSITNLYSYLNFKENMSRFLLKEN